MPTDFFEVSQDLICEIDDYIYSIFEDQFCIIQNQIDRIQDFYDDQVHVIHDIGYLFKDIVATFQEKLSIT